MTAARVSSRPPERRPPLLAVPSGEERVPERVRLGPTLARELRRLESHPLRELRRLEREARAGESPATPVILMAGMAVVAWSLVALVVGLASLLAHLLA